MIKILLATMISISSIGFTNEASEDWNNELREAIQTNENEVVDHYDEDKIYVKPDKIHPTPQGVYLNLNENEYIFVPTLNSDSQGCYIPCWLDLDPLNTCPGCGTRYWTGGCGKPSCPEYQRQQSNKNEYQKDKERKKESEKEKKKENKKKKS